MQSSDTVQCTPGARHSLVATHPAAVYPSRPHLTCAPPAPQLPGLWKQRKREVKELEEEAGAPGELQSAAWWLVSVPAVEGGGGEGVGEGGGRARSVCKQRGSTLLSVGDGSARGGRARGGWLKRRRCCRPSLPASPPAVIWAAWLNRGTNFSREEREALRLEGLLPPVVESLDLQAE